MTLLLPPQSKMRGDQQRVQRSHESADDAQGPQRNSEVDLQRMTNELNKTKGELSRVSDELISAKSEISQYEAKFRASASSEGAGVAEAPANEVSMEEIQKHIDEKETLQMEAEQQRGARERDRKAFEREKSELRDANLKLQKERDHHMQLAEMGRQRKDEEKGGGEVEDEVRDKGSSSQFAHFTFYLAKELYLSHSHTHARRNATTKWRPLLENRTVVRPTTV